MNEFVLIKKYFSPLSKKYKGALSLADDAAIFSGKENFVVTKDLMVEGVHFFNGADPEKLAQKLLRVNLSDIAAMGAVPKFYLLGLTLPKNIKESWLKAFAAGLKKDQEKYKISLIGGDTTAHDGPIILSLTMVGETRKNILKRSGAKKGDFIYVTGTIGDAFLGLNILEDKIKEKAEFLIERFNLPTPRLDVSNKIVGIANSCVDISDGLAADLSHILTASKVSAEIFLDKIPVSKQAKKILERKPHLIKEMITCGDDYELCFTVPPQKEIELLRIFSGSKTKITKIGRVINSGGAAILNIYDMAGEKVVLEKKGFQHL